MIRHTGGRSSLPGPTSTRSNSASRAMARAWGSGLIPSFAPSSPISSTSRARMRSLIRASSTAAMLASPLRFGTRRAAPAADSHQEAPPLGHRLRRPVAGRSSTESKDDPGADRSRARDRRPGGDHENAAVPLPYWIAVAPYQAHEQPLDSIR